MSPAYPPEPWHLTGVGHLTLWRVPVGALPPLPFRARPVVVRGQALVATAFVAYGEPGDMSYDELLAAVVVRHGRHGARVGVSITEIWVDSPVSRAGGRGLWGIPKELATFDGLSAAEGAATARAGGAIAAAAFAPARGALPLPFPLPGRVVQTLRGRTVASPIRAAGRLERAHATWDLDPDGPLSWLRPGRPLVSAVARDFRMTFGAVSPTR